MSRKAVLERTLGKKAAKKFTPKPVKPAKAGTVTLDLPCELLEQIVKAELTSLHESLTADLEARRQGTGTAIFELDQQVDIKILEGHLFCLETILKYYGASLK